MSSTLPMPAEQNRLIAQTVAREGRRLRAFIRARVSEVEDAEDITQEVFAELVLAYRMLKPVEQAAGWLFAVARNRIIDRLRQRRRDAARAEPRSSADALGELDALLPSAAGGPETAYARDILIAELEAAIEELPEAQRTVFIAHAIENRSFKDLAVASDTNINTLLARKRAAVMHLRTRLKDIYDVFADERTSR